MLGLKENLAARRAAMRCFFNERMRLGCSLAAELFFFDLV